MHAVLSHNINYVYDSFKYRLYRQLTRFGNGAMHTHFIWSVWDVDLLPLEDQAKSFASVMQVGQEAECHMNPHINMVILKLYIWRLTRPLDWWMQYLAGRHHMCDLWQRDPEQCWLAWLFHSVPGATWAAYSQSREIRRCAFMAR